MPSEPPPPTSSWFAFLASRGASLDGGRVSDFGAPRDELLAARDHTIVADLSHNALVGVAGDDATAFLHAQFTNDVESLPEGAAQWNGWCSAKGRLLATFLLLKRAEGYLLVLPAEIAPAFARRLGMFVLRSKVKIRDASAERVHIGFAGKSAGVIVARHFGHTPDPLRAIERDDATVVALDAERYLILATPASAQATWDTLAENTAKAGAAAWEWTSIRAGIPIILPATQEAFVPQMANFELLGGVSFKKGCYPGQEIVARTQYRGILKKRMALAHASGDLPPAAGVNVYSSAFGAQAAGEVVNAAPAPGGGCDLLVVAQIESLRSGDLRLGSPDGPPLQIRSHPATESPA